MHCSRLTLQLRFGLAAHRSCPEPPRTGVGGEQGDGGDGGKEEEQEPGDWVSGLSDDSRRG